MKRQLVLFCGGSGASSLVRALSRIEEIELTILVNCYDDGLSTGKLRALIPGMLGPSDVRKNVRHSLVPESKRVAALGQLLDYRLPPNGMRASGVQRWLPAVLTKSGHLCELGAQQRGTLMEAVGRFLDHVVTQDARSSLDDVSLANMFFAGLYLEHPRFNDTVEKFVDFFGIRNRIFNLTDGTDLKLVGLTQTSRLVPNESTICHLPPNERIQDVFLLEDYLTEPQRRALQPLELAAKCEHLSARNRFPPLNRVVSDTIAAADIIVYWAGTQHSSLFPGYLTNGLAEAIGSSNASRKVLVTNVLKDHDIQNETAYSLVDKFFWFMSRKNVWTSDAQGLVTDMLLNDPHGDSITTFLPLGTPNQTYRGAAPRVNGWAGSHGGHDTGKVLAWLISGRS